MLRRDRAADDPKSHGGELSYRAGGLQEPGRGRDGSNVFFYGSTVILAAILGSILWSLWSGF